MDHTRTSVAALTISILTACGGTDGPSTAGVDGGSTGDSEVGDAATDVGDANAGDVGTGDVAVEAGDADASAVCGPDPGASDEILPDTTDPVQGVFTMSDALAGLPEGPGPLRAILETDAGTLTCTLRPDKAPNGVANFIGLARGLRPWKEPTLKKWVRRRFYDGLTFHRVIAGFVAQGGDPLGTGYGGPGYKFADEISDLAHHPGTLAYASSGPDTNGSQFYVAEADLPSLDGQYTTFGECTPVSVVSALTHVPTDPNDKPLTPLTLKEVTITRCAP